MDLSREILWRIVLWELLLALSKLHLNTKLNFSFFAYLIRDCATFLTNFSFSNKHGPDIKVSLSVSFLIRFLDNWTDLGIFIH